MKRLAAFREVGVFMVEGPSSGADLLRYELRLHPSADAWEPVFAIADAAGGEWSIKARLAAVELSKIEEGDELGRGAQLLAAIRTAMIGLPAMSTADLLDADENGVVIRFHASPPWSARRWIGVIRDPRPISDHCLLMSGGDCLFDGARALPKAHDQPASNRDPADIDYGITIE